ncbi:CRISPR-associated protein Csx16 [Vibrio navarrensis]|nr:CRISPR-associated protein Csx16 [Vibrio navarrensis]EJL6565996.1 CRISPR-associated protein Csx16 [Vibrio navarrensis]
MRWFITRHPGAKEWAVMQGLHIDRFVTHLAVDDIAAGDEVIGTLPVHLAAEVCAKPARYFHLSLQLPEHLRGHELSAEQMNHCQASIREFLIHAC